ncbi:MAG: hypothetical protein GX654_18610 [Desulfatiglans sp.]|nr:hypothetical protein [Desulfatiglans sp.]
MGSDWPLKKFGDLFNIKHGFAFKGEYFTDVETRYLLTTPGNFAIGGGFQNDKPKYYNGPIPDDYILNAGDIIVTMTDLSKASDTLGNAAIVPEDSNIWLHNQRIGLLEFKDPTKSHPKFISYLLRSYEYRSWIIGSATGTTVKHTSPRRISEFGCPLPPLSEQKAIAHILSSLDDKIELNRRMNATLEGMAQALFKSWFVDFDPVIDNAILAGNSIPDEFAERAEVRRAMLDKKQNAEKEKSSLHNSSCNTHHSLFPATFQLTEEMGWIPEGWEVIKSSSLFDVRDGTHDSPKQSATGKYLITSRHITGNTIDYSNAYLISEEDFEQVNKRSKVDPYDILLTMIGTVGSPFLVMEEEINFAIKNIGLFKTGVNRTLATYFFTYLKSDFMKAFMESRLAGTTQKYLTLKILREIPIIIPRPANMKGFGAQILLIFDKIHSNNCEVNTLAKLRDTLLPKLISGELRIPDAEKLTEEALV